MTEGEIIALIGIGGTIIVALITQICQYSSIKKDIKNMKQHDDEQYLDILRLTIMNDNIPVTERIIAGKKYIERGGNGEVKKFFENFLEEHVKE